jgi:Holliday junction resolvase RusA-like endonuclease
MAKKRDKQPPKPQPPELWEGINLFIPGLPRGQSRSRSALLFGRDGKPVEKHGRPIITHHKSAEQEQDEARIIEQLSVLWNRPPFRGPVKIYIRAIFALNQERQRKYDKGIRLYHTTRPDFDNVAKHICDCFTGRVWLNDTQVVSGRVDKCYGERPGYWIQLSFLRE